MPKKKKQQPRSLGAEERGWFRLAPGADGPQSREIPSLGVKLVGGSEDRGSAVVELTGAQLRDLTRSGINAEPAERPEAGSDPRAGFLNKDRPGPAKAPENDPATADSKEGE